MTRVRAFSLIELMTVITIVAILAALIFPAFARAKDSAYRSSDMANMNSLRSALQVYRADQGGYPPALLGYASLYLAGPDAGDVVPADQVRGFLFPKRVGDLSLFKPAPNRQLNSGITKAVWPPQDPRPVGEAPYADLSGDGMIDATDDYADARQAFGPGDGFVMRPKPDATASALANLDEDIDNESGTEISAYFYRISGYDVAEVQLPTGANRWELRYAPFWTNWGLGGGNARDDPRQLGYNDPPDHTIITWNSYFREYEAGVVQRRNRDIVLLLGGAARMVDSRDMSERSFRSKP